MNFSDARKKKKKRKLNKIKILHVSWPLRIDSLLCQSIVRASAMQFKFAFVFIFLMNEKFIQVIALHLLKLIRSILNMIYTLLWNTRNYIEFAPDILGEKRVINNGNQRFQEYTKYIWFRSHKQSWQNTIRKVQKSSMFKRWKYFVF